jgi:hypothetical protein
MNISWVLSDTAVLDPTVDIVSLKNLGSIWGSWRTWRSYQTDNVICYDMNKAGELIKRDFHNSCNFYIPSSIHAPLQRPQGVNLFEGAFVHDVERQEEIVAMHLAASVSDIVLLLGFDFSEQSPYSDRLLEHRAHNYRGLTKQALKDNPAVQWVAIDHPGQFRKDLLELDNLGQDTLTNILQT